jgi:WD40 repeat protein
MKKANIYQTLILLFVLVITGIPAAALQTFTPQPPPIPGVCDLAFSPDGRMIAAASSGGYLALWESDTGALLHEFYNKGNCPSLIFSNDSETLFTLYPGVIGGEYAETVLWDVQTGTEIRHFTGRGILSDDHQVLLTTAPDAPDRLWNVATGQVIRSFNSSVHIQVGGVISPANSRLLSYNWPQRFPELWDITTGEQEFAFPVGEGWISWLQFLPDSQHALVLYAPDGLALWNLDTLTQERVFPERAIGSTLWQSDDGQMLLTGYDDGFFLTWDVLSGELLHETPLTPPIPYDGMTGSRLSNDGRSFLIELTGGIAQLWDVETGTLKYQFDPPADSGVDWSQTRTQTAFSADDRYVLVGYSNETLHLWDAETGTEVRSYLLPPR